MELTEKQATKLRTELIEISKEINKISENIFDNAMNIGTDELSQDSFGETVVHCSLNDSSELINIANRIPEILDPANRIPEKFDFLSFIDNKIMRKK